MELLQTVYDSGDITWLIPAMVGALIVFLGLIRLLFSETVGWALAILIVFGGALSGVSVFARASLPERIAPVAAKDGIGIDAVAAMSQAGEKLKEAVGANTEAIESVQFAIMEIRGFTEILAAASSAAMGDVAPTGAEVSSYKKGVETLLADTSAAIDRSKNAEMEAVRTLAILNQAIEKKLKAPAQ